MTGSVSSTPMNILASGNREPDDVGPRASPYNSTLEPTARLRLAAAQRQSLGGLRLAVVIGGDFAANSWGLVHFPASSVRSNFDTGLVTTK